MEFVRRLMMLFRREQFERELREEMRLHGEMKVRELLRDGYSPQDARYAAQRQMGNTFLQLEDSRDAWGWRWLMDSVQDARFGLRMLRKNPGFTFVAVLTLALGIGANTAVFSVTDAVVLRPLPFPQPKQLVALWETNKAEGNQPWRVAPANFKDWREQAECFSDVAAFGGFAATLTGRGEPFQVRGGIVTANYFTTLGVQPVLGRSFESADETSAKPFVILGYELWQSRFAGSREVPGSTVTLDGKQFTVIGVMPRGIYPAWPVNGPRIHFLEEYQDIWRLMSPEIMNYRRSHVLGVVARMKPGVTVPQAQQQMDVIAGRLEQTYRENQGEGALVRPLMDEVVGAVRPALFLLLGAVSAILLVACSNVASLLLARLTARRHEIAVRSALGASRATLVRQFLVEGLMLSAMATGAGVWLAYQGQGVLLSLVPQDIPRLSEVGLNLRVLAFTACASLLVAIAFALAPAWSSRRVNVSDALKETARGSEAARSLRLRNALVIAQVSVAVVLTLAAGLLAQSFSRMARVSPGFRAENLVLAEIALSHGKYTQWQKVEAVQRQMLSNIRNLPGVGAAHLAYDHPLDTNWLTGFSLADQPNLATDSVQLRIVTPGYFGGLGQPLVAGREFDERETPLRPGVAIINESFVRRYFPDGRAVGKTLLSDAASYGWRGQMPNRFEVIGVASDVRTPGVETRVEPFLYFSAWQFPQREMNVLVRTTNDVATTTALLRQAVRELDPDLPITRIRTMDSIISQTIAQPRLNTVLMSSFSALGLLLALVGVYGLVSYWVAACSREIGIRVALGASRADVFVLVLRRGAILIAPGLAMGVAGALALSQFLRAQLFEISPVDPLTYVAVPAAVAVAGLAACLLPARSAMCADLVTALRGE